MLFRSDKWLVSVSGNEVKIWNNETSRLIKNIKFSVNFDGPVNETGVIAISPDSKTIAFQNADSLFFFNFDKFDFDKKLYLSNPLQEMVFSADSKTLYAGGHLKEKYDDMFIQKVDVVTASIATVIHKYSYKGMASHSIDKLSISPDGSQLLVYDAVIGSRLFDLKSNKLTKSFEKEPYSAYTFLSNGNIIAYSGEKQKAFFIEEIDAKTYKSIRKTTKIFDDTNDISAQFYATSYPSVSGKIGIEYQGEVIIFDANTFTLSNKFSFANPDLGMNNAQNICLSPNGKYYIQGLKMSRYDLKTNKLQKKYGILPALPDVHFPLQHTEGVWMADRILTFKDGGFKMRRIPIPCEKCGYTIRLTQDGSKGFLIADNDLGVYSFDPNAKNIQYKAIESIPKSNLVGLRLYESMGLMVVVHSEGAYVVDLKTNKIKTQIKKPENGGSYALYERGLKYFSDISPDKSKLLLYGGSVEENNKSVEYVYCYDLASKSLMWTFKGNWISNIRFTDNGKKVSLTSIYNLTELDANTGKQIGNPISVSKSGWEWTTVLSPSGKRAVTTLYEESKNGLGPDIDLFDVASKKQTGVLKGPDSRVEAMIFLKDERYLVAEEYGGLRIWDLEKKREVAKILLFEDTDDWMIMTPDGRFDASPDAMKKMYFTKGKEVIPLESLYEQFYVPNLLSQVWESDLPKNSGADIKKLKSPPSVKIMYSEAKERNLEVSDDDNVPIFKATQPNVSIQIEANKNGDNISEIRLYQNNKLIFTKGKIGETIEAAPLTVPLSLINGDNRLKAVAINSQRTESQPNEIIINFKPDKNTPSVSGGNTGGIQLYLIVVGINVYKNSKYNLNYALADATAFKDAFESGATGVFSKVNTTFITNADANKAGIEAAFEKVKSAAKPQDLFVFYYAGHGVMNEKKEFFLVPHDVTQLYGADDALAQKGLSANQLQQFSKDIKAQKQLFILDACQSAGALQMLAAARGAAEEKAIAQLARSTGTHWLTASGSEQFASEFTQLGHGAFTYTLLEGLKGGADTGDKKITVKEIDAYLQNKVPEVTQKYKGTPQYPSSYGYGNDFPIGVVKN